MMLTFRVDLDIVTFDLPAKSQVCMSIHSAGRLRQTHTDDVKTITSYTSRMWGVMNTMHDDRVHDLTWRGAF